MDSVECRADASHILPVLFLPINRIVYIRGLVKEFFHSLRFESIHPSSVTTPTSLLYNTRCRNKAFHNSFLLDLLLAI